MDLVVKEADQAVAAESNEVEWDEEKSSTARCGVRWKTKRDPAQPLGPAMATSTGSLPSLAHSPGPRCRAGTCLVCLLHVHHAPQRRGGLLSETTTAPPGNPSTWTPLGASPVSRTEREPPYLVAGVADLDCLELRQGFDLF
jgi:hypothetical protein